ncbi:MAG: hypothetical protein WBP29_02900, partial [Candidatus Zixiibacteriota bacterium]
GEDPADTIVQFFFVRAIDNDSIHSEVAYSVYSRSNNPPNTEILTIPDRTGYFDVPVLNSTYFGIPFEWKGTDKIDFPNDADQPVFEFYYQVFGPYTSSDLEFDRFGRLVEGFEIDTLDISKLVLSSRDTTRGGVWVKSTGATFYNLWRNASFVDTTRENYFVAKVTARDDATTPDPTPDYVAFRAVYPRFEKDILIYAPALCRENVASGNVPCTRNNIWFGEYGITDLQAYYKRIVAAAGYPNATFTEDWLNKITIAKHKLVIMFGDGEGVLITDTVFSNAFKVLTDYMRLGGNVWAWAPAPFGKLAGPSASNEGLISFGPSSLPLVYFSVIGEYHPGWIKSYLAKAQADPASDTIPVSNEQFAGGLALGGTGLNDFQIDLEKVQGTYLFDREADSTSLRYVQFRAAPSTSYFVRDVLSQPLFLYSSVFDSGIPDSIKTWIQPLQGSVIAIRTDRGLFKSATFGFSAWSMREEDAIDLTTKMIDWFLQ